MRISLNFKLIGRRVKESRIRRHISQAELAERIELSVSYISYIENAKKQASLNVLVRISNELGITVDELLCGNQIYDSSEYHTDMELLMSDCSSYEKRVIFELAHAIKAVLRGNQVL
jgi:transcriptional regulator with XRE-family HTH domain